MSSDGIVFHYGSYEHQPNEVYPKIVEARPMPNEDGVRWATLYRMQVAGDLCAPIGEEFTPGSIATRMSNMDAAYLNDYQDAYFNLPDGGGRAHEFLTDDAANLSGNKIVHRSWDHLTQAEFATTRSFSVTLQALYRESYQQVIAFRETTTQVGTGGPIFRTYNLFNGTPVRINTHAVSKVKHVTRGTIVGLNTWPEPPPPYWPAEEQQWLRVKTQHSPHHHGHLSFDKGTHYRVDYTYFFERPSAVPIQVNNWFFG